MVERVISNGLEKVFTLTWGDIWNNLNLTGVTIFGCGDSGVNVISTKLSMHLKYLHLHTTVFLESHYQWVASLKV